MLRLMKGIARRFLPAFLYIHVRNLVRKLAISLVGPVMPMPNQTVGELLARMDGLALTLDERINRLEMRVRDLKSGQTENQQKFRAA